MVDSNLTIPIQKGRVVVAKVSQSKLEVYYNLHKHCLSVRRDGKVIEHRKSIVLHDVVFAVQPAGREKCILEKKKNVHAFVRGYRASTISLRTVGRSVTVKYNPYMYESFMNTTDGQPIYSAKYVAIRDRQVTAYL
jgi:hypothetical protein